MSKEKKMYEIVNEMLNEAWEDAYLAETEYYNNDMMHEAHNRIEVLEEILNKMKEVLEEKES